MTGRIGSVLILACAIFLLTRPSHTWWEDLLASIVVALWVAMVASVYAETK